MKLNLPGGSVRHYTNSNDARPSRRRFEVNDHEPKGLNRYAFSYYERLSNVRKYVEKNFQGRLSLEATASVAGLEKSYFSKYFHRTTGITYSSWLSWIRVKKAAELLRTKDVSITDAGFRVGFGDLRTFERAVKKHTGFSPRELKKLLRPVGSNFCGLSILLADGLDCSLMMASCAI